MKQGLNIRALAHSRNAKYSTINLVFCAIVVAIAIMINSIFSVCADAFGWYGDMTGEQIFTLSDKTIETLEQAPKDVTVEIIFPLEKDKIEKNFATSNTSGSIGYIHATAVEIASNFDNIEVSYHNTVKEPVFYDQFAGSKSGVAPSPKTVVIARRFEDGSYGEYRNYSINSFYIGNSSGNLYAYNGEAIFATAILALSFDYTPTAYFTVGHGESSFSADCPDGVTSETIDASTAINPSAKELIKLFCLSNFTVKPLDLSVSDIPSDARVIVINQPKTDIVVSANEDAKIRSYLNDSAKTLFCFTGSGVNLPNLYSLIETWSGAKVDSSITPITDTSSAVLNQDNAFFAKPSNNQASLAYFGELNDYGSAKAFISNAVGISITDDEFLSENGKLISNTVRFTLPVIYTSKNAVSDSKIGAMPLMTITSSVNRVDNDSTFSYLVLCSSEGFASSSAITDSSVANKDMIYSLIHATSAAQALVNIKYKTFINYKLDITAPQARIITILTSSILPLGLIVGGIIVVRRRKIR